MLISMISAQYRAVIHHGQQLKLLFTGTMSFCPRRSHKALKGRQKHREKHGKMLDYGCGKGFSADRLNMAKYDPFFYPENLGVAPNEKSIARALGLLKIVSV